MDWDDILLLAGLPFAIALPLLAAWRKALLRWQFLDRPVERSSHLVPTPTGGGVAVMAVVVAACLFQSIATDDVTIIGTVLIVTSLCVVSWIDDIHHLPPALRLGLHAAAVAAGIWQLWPVSVSGEGGLPGTPPLWAAMIAVGWTWFINLYNFMDGIDGMAGVESLSLAIGIVAVAAIAGAPDHILATALSVAGAALAFLVWNWHPAKLFLGDAGSVPLGFLLGWLLLSLALNGAWLPALILPLYYLADATLTLGRRIWQRQPVWQAHHQHFYQLAVRGDLNHRQVVVRVAACNAVLVLAALAALAHPVPAASAATAAVLALLLNLRHHARFVHDEAALP